MFGPPTIAGLCYKVWHDGKHGVLRALKDPASIEPSGVAHLASALTVGATYGVQQKVVLPLFDQGGALSLDWKKGTESLGEPLKIQTWRHFYRAAGPPVFARCAAVIFSFYVAGYVDGRVAARGAKWR